MPKQATNRAGDARERLLATVIAELDAHGMRDRSLRDIAEAAGTSHRMLIHHFGSRDGLLVAIVETVEAGERERALAVGPPDDGTDFADAFRASWRHFAQPRLAGRERLFFECYARALQGEEPFDRLVPDAVTTWVDALARVDRGRGVAPATARANARLHLALIRGLLLDLLATGDRRGTTAALDAFLASRA
jgi:AcrR family transcriptional regulator